MWGHYKTGSPTNQGHTGFRSVDSEKVADQDVALKDPNLPQRTYHTHTYCTYIHVAFSAVIQSMYTYKKQDALNLNKSTTALFALFKQQHMCCLHCVFCKMRPLPTAKHVSRSQARVCVYILQLYTQYFSALSGFTQHLLTPTAFVLVQRITKEVFPRQSHLWLRHVFTWLIPSLP